VEQIHDPSDGADYTHTVKQEKPAETVSMAKAR